MSLKFQVIAVAVLLCTPSLARAGEPPPTLTPGNQVQVNTYTTGIQSVPTVTLNQDGEMVAVWAGSGEDGSGLSVVGRRGSSSGVWLGIPFLVNSYTLGDQGIADVAITDDGDFIVVWQSDYQDGNGLGIAAQKYNSDGNSSGAEFLINTYTTGNQSTPKVDIETLDDFLIIWNSTDQDGDQGGILSREFVEGAPLGEEFINEFTSGNQDQPDLARDEESGDYLVFWRGEDITEGAIPLSISGKKYKPFGTEQAPEGGGFPPGTFVIGSAGTNPASEGFPSGEFNRDGNFITVWQREDMTGDVNIIARMFNSDATPIGAEFQVNTYETGYQGKASVDLDDAGNFIIAWTSTITPGVRQDIRARIGSFSAAGPVGDEFQVNDLETIDAGNASVSLDGNQNFIVLWHSFGSVGNDTSSLSIQSRRFEGTCLAFNSCLFTDGFETGDASAWSAVVP